jgi:hypothetical protein
MKAFPNASLTVPGTHRSDSARRYRKLAARGKNVNIAVVAVARELAGFIWDISKLAMSLAVTRNEQPAQH